MTHRYTLPAALALTAGLCLSGTAWADSKKDLVAKVIQLQQPAVENIARGIASQTAQQELQTAGQAMGRVPPDKREAVGKDIQADVKKFYDEVEPMLKDKAAKLAPAAFGPILEEKFTEEELKQVITWMESSAAKKYQQIGSELQNALAQKLVADTRGSVEPKIKALEASMQKKLGLPPAPMPSASAPKGPVAPTTPAMPAASAAAPAKK